MSSQVLKATKDHLSDFNNWCPSGPTRVSADGKCQMCIIVAVSERSRDFAIDMSYPMRFVREAAREKLGVYCSIAEYNDGRGCGAGIPDRERWRNLHTVLDRAIELADE